MTGIVALIIIAISFAAGRFLDNYLDVRGVFTVTLLLVSFPITLFAMVKISLYMVAKTQNQINEMQQIEDQTKSETETAEKEEAHR